MILSCHLISFQNIQYQILDEIILTNVNHFTLVVNLTNKVDIEGNYLVLDTNGSPIIISEMTEVGMKQFWNENISASILNNFSPAIVTIPIDPPPL